MDTIELVDGDGFCFTVIGTLELGELEYTKHANAMRGRFKLEGEAPTALFAAFRGEGYWRSSYDPSCAHMLGLRQEGKVVSHLAYETMENDGNLFHITGEWRLPLM